MRILSLAILAALTATASAHERYYPVCEVHGFYTEGAIGKTAYRDPCFYGKPKHVAKKRAVRPAEQMAYKNPSANSIYNHPAKGMKHKRNEEKVNLHEGTPRAYQLLGTSLFYGPYLYSPRDREHF